MEMPIHTEGKTKGRQQQSKQTNKLIINRKKKKGRFLQMKWQIRTLVQSEAQCVHGLCHIASDSC